MLLDFNHGTDPADLVSVFTAVRRGHRTITIPVLCIMMVVGFGGFALVAFTSYAIVGILCVLVAPFAGWTWWSYATPRWRERALGRGANAASLQRLAEKEKIVWPVGHPFEKTEFRRRR